MLTRAELKELEKEPEFLRRQAGWWAEFARLLRAAGLRPGPALVVAKKYRARLRAVERQRRLADLQSEISWLSR
jgi:hypothetical protein